MTKKEFLDNIKDVDDNAELMHEQIFGDTKSPVNIIKIIKTTCINKDGKSSEKQSIILK